MKYKNRQITFSKLLKAGSCSIKLAFLFLRWDLQNIIKYYKWLTRPSTLKCGNCGYIFDWEEHYRRLTFQIGYKNLPLESELDVCDACFLILPQDMKSSKFVMITMQRNQKGEFYY